MYKKLNAKISLSIFKYKYDVFRYNVIKKKPAKITYIVLEFTLVITTCVH